MSELTVYKASAGSGKTFTLAVEYIKFLIENPNAFKNILAVTFTNKATDEMKFRIMSQLYGISNSLSDSDDYARKIIKETGVDADGLRVAAEKSLHLLTHNYDYFHVETIDSFFQTILRNLAKELDLSPNLKVDLNDRQVEEEAVDRLIEELKPNDQVYKWLMEYIENNIDENNSWNVTRNLKNFGMKVFDNEYKDNRKDLAEVFAIKNFTKTYKERLKAALNKYVDELSKCKDCFFRLLDHYSIQETDFKGGSRSIVSYFGNVTDVGLEKSDFKTKTIASHLISEDSWIGAKHPDRNRIRDIVSETLIPLLEETERRRNRTLSIKNSIEITLKNIDNLKLLRDIEDKIRSVNAERGRFMLSDTQNFLKQMISDTDSPFVFEKIGTHLEHIMIDEFQDTSITQWHNFKILLKECMSHVSDKDNKTNNMLIGDVKQSIYRFRDGDWKLLNSIDQEFAKGEVEINNSLDTNYRSARNIVDFNNCFFSSACKIEAENEKTVSEELSKMIPSAYSDINQKPHKQEREGLVNIKLLKNDVANNDDESYEQRTLNELGSIIDGILQKGVPQSKIAILTRSNYHISLIAEYFAAKRRDIRIVSDEAFRLDHSIALNIIMDAMKLVYIKSDQIVKASLIKNYQLYIKGNELTANSIFIENGANSLLPKEYIEESAALNEMPLYDLAEHLYEIFELRYLQCENAYICAFFDCLSNYVTDMSADALEFIDAWETNYRSSTIQTDGINGIRILSIHKSKGLEYDNVIIPFCSWSLRPNPLRPNLIWCKPSVEPFNMLPIIPVKYENKLNSSIYSKDYCIEHMQMTIDDLNMLYVAFTRASSNLFVIGKRKNEKSKTPNRSAVIEESLGTLLANLQGSTISGTDSIENDIEFCYGTFKASAEKKEQDTDNIFLKKDKRIEINIDVHPIPLGFRQSNKSKEFIAEAGDDSVSKVSTYVKTGNVLHSIFSRIHTAEDIERVITEYENNGVLYDGCMTRDRLLETLNTYMSTNQMVEDWFSPHWVLFNECSILSIDEHTGELIERRPDRVMKDGDKVVIVDFKFGKMHDKYTKQVQEYIKLIQNMGYNDVKGYLWFVATGDIKEIIA